MCNDAKMRSVSGCCTDACRQLHRVVRPPKKPAQFCAVLHSSYATVLSTCQLPAGDAAHMLRLSVDVGIGEQRSTRCAASSSVEAAGLHRSCGVMAVPDHAQEAPSCSRGVCAVTMRPSLSRIGLCCPMSLPLARKPAVFLLCDTQLVC